MKSIKRDNELIRTLLVDNPTLNNVQITHLYNDIKGESNNPETFRKHIKQVRKDYNIGNSASKYTSKAFYTKKETSYQAEDSVKKTFKWFKVDTEKGEIKSEIEVSFEPRDHDQLAELHNVDLNVYKITNYWSKLQPNGYFTSSLLCSLRKVGDSVTADEIIKSVEHAITSKVNKIKRAVVDVPKIKNDKTLILWVSDEHVGSAVSGSIYNNHYDGNEYFKRKMTLLDTVEKESKKNGGFDNIIVCSLGDNLDGNSGKTTRSVLGDHTHGLPQNMTNAEAITTYVEVNKQFYKELVDMGVTEKITLYNINNSNHGGLGFDFSANYTLEVYLKAVYGDLFDIKQLKDIYNYFDLYDNRIVITHGKDETIMKRNLPLLLNPNIELQLTEYLDEIGRKKENFKNFIVKGDLHQFASQQGRYFHYQNIPSLFGSSAWIHANFGRGNAGYCFSVVSKDEPNGIGFTPVWIK